MRASAPGRRWLRPLLYDEHVNSPRQRTARPALRRWQALCVLGLLAGLLGMHGLAPGGGLRGPTHAQQADALPSHTPRTHTPGIDMTQTQLVPYVHCAGGHVQHADATCASGAVGGGPVLPPLVPDPVPAVVRDSAVRAYAGGDSDDARAPPSLAELQLLRI
ncbi:DUF6153 family protein [Streptomyces sp. NPDC002130]|uniref:DUF6153 family protein n=1 Tax=Streptomyces sp. NPDC002130 TaxID=3155568 RepID=UPI00332C57E0